MILLTASIIVLAIILTVIILIHNEQSEDFVERFNDHFLVY